MRCNQWTALVAAAVIIGSAVPASAALRGGGALPEAQSCSYGDRMLNPPSGNVPEPVEISGDLEHHYEYPIGEDYPADDSVETGLAYYKDKYDAAWAAYQAAEDYYERKLRQCEMESALEMIEMYRAVRENPVHLEF